MLPLDSIAPMGITGSTGVAPAAQGALAGPVREASHKEACIQQSHGTFQAFFRLSLEQVSRRCAPDLSDEVPLGNGSRMLCSHALLCAFSRTLWGRLPVALGRALTIAITPGHRGLFQTMEYTSHSNHRIFLLLWYHPAGKNRSDISCKGSGTPRSERARSGLFQPGL